MISFRSRRGLLPISRSHESALALQRQIAFWFNVLARGSGILCCDEPLIVVLRPLSSGRIQRVHGHAGARSRRPTLSTCAESVPALILAPSLSCAGPENEAECVIRGRRITPTDVKTVQELLLE